MIQKIRLKRQSFLCALPSVNVPLFITDDSRMATIYLETEKQIVGPLNHDIS